MFSLTSLSVRSLQLPFNSFRDQSIEALRKTDLEWTQIYNGFFLDYWGMPHVDTYLTPLVFAVDIGNRIAAIPGATGDEIITLTYTKDLGKFVVAALSLPKWDEALYCYSENSTWNKLIQAAEEATGEYQASENRKPLTGNRTQVQHHV
jgi:hypothetical protein